MRNRARARRLTDSITATYGRRDGEREGVLNAHTSCALSECRPFDSVTRRPRAALRFYCLRFFCIVSLAAKLYYFATRYQLNRENDSPLSRFFKDDSLSRAIKLENFRTYVYPSVQPHGRELKWS